MPPPFVPHLRHVPSHSQVPVVSAKSKKQRGFVAVSMKFASNESMKKDDKHPAAHPQQPTMLMPMPMPMPMMAPPPYGMMPGAYAYPPQMGYGYSMQQPAMMPAGAWPQPPAGGAQPPSGGH